MNELDEHLKEVEQERREIARRAVKIIVSLFNAGREEEAIDIFLKIYQRGKR